jgi:hypothetical protein
MKKLILLSSLFVFLFSACSKDSSVSNTGGGTGQGGSLARFTIVGNYLYTVDGEYLNVFDISSNSKMTYKNKVQIGFGIEAIYPFRDKLFIASNTAMYIYSITNPETPTQESQAQHLTGCDPVVANDSVAYLTIHGGNRCGSQINQLQVYDVKNISNPIFKKSYTLTNPMGLGMYQQHLYVCDNGTGIRIYDISNPYNPIAKQILTGENFVDVIIVPNLTSQTTLVCMLTDGVAFYDITDPTQIVKLGTVKN